MFLKQPGFEQQFNRRYKMEQSVFEVARICRRRIFSRTQDIICGVLN